MAIQQLGADGTSVLVVDPTFKAARASMRPVEVIGWYSFGATSGLVTAVAAAGPVFSLRNTGANLLMVRRVQVGFGVTTAFTAAQLLAYQLFFARSFTVSDSAGTPIFTAGMNKHRAGFTNITSAPDIRIAAAGALTAGTRTLDSLPLGVAAGGATGVGVALPPFALLSHDAGDYPLILAQNEGLVITNAFAMGAAGVINLHVNIEFAEVASY